MESLTESDDDNLSTYHAKRAFQVHSTIPSEDIEIEDYYTHTKVSGPAAEEFVDKFCGDAKGKFNAKLKKSPLVDDVDYYIYTVK